MLLRKPPERAEVYNDIDGDVVNLFRVLRDPKMAEQLNQLVELTPYSRTEFFATYEPTDDPLERARRTVARAAMAFGSTSRSLHRTGFRATPFRGRSTTGVQDWRSYPGHIPSFVDRLRNVVIEDRPALDVIRQQDAPGVLFYVDPPYPVSTRTPVRCPGELGRAYARDLDDDEHRELAQVLRSLEGMVVLSSYPCDLYEDLYPDWQQVRKEALGDSGARRTEVLWISPAAEFQRRLFA